MEGEYGTNGEEVHTRFWWRNWRKGATLEALCVTGEILLKYILIGWEGMYWICVAQIGGLF